jgi:hypothetical protein
MLNSRSQCVGLVSAVMLSAALQLNAEAQTANFGYAQIPFVGGVTGVTSVALDGNSNAFVTSNFGTVEEIPLGCSSSNCVKSLTREQGRAIFAKPYKCFI